MPTKIERIKLEALLRETLGLASTGNDPVVINEPPVVPVQPKPSVSGAEVGKLKSVPAFETNPTMRKLGKLLSKLSEDQQSSVYKKLRKSMKKVREQANEEQQLARIIEGMINEITLDDLDDTDGPSAEDLAAIEGGDEFAGNYVSPEMEEKIEEIGEMYGIEQADLEKAKAATSRPKLSKEQLAKINLNDPANRAGPTALDPGTVIDAISVQMGVSRSAVTNVLYDYFELMGDSQLRRRPSERKKRSTSEDPNKKKFALDIEQMIYAHFLGEIEESIAMKFLPEMEREFPKDFVTLSDLPIGDYRKELYRNYSRLILSDRYMPNDDNLKIYSAADVVGNWHLLANNTDYDLRHHGFRPGLGSAGIPRSKKVVTDDGKKGVLVPFSEENPDGGIKIKEDIANLIKKIRPGDFEQLILRANALIDADKTAGAQGAKGVLAKVDKEAEKIRKRKEKAAKKRK